MYKSWGENYRQWLTNKVDTDNNQHTMERTAGTSYGETVVRRSSYANYAPRFDVVYTVQSYWSLLLFCQCQLANPLSSRHMPDSGRAAAKDLCVRAGMMTERKTISVVEELDRQSDAYSRTSAVAERRIHNNLLLFYAERKSTGPCF